MNDYVLIGDNVYNLRILNRNADELEHYGVIGMKWGVRKERKLSERISKINRALRNKGLSEEERARMRRKYNRLMAKRATVRSNLDSSQKRLDEKAAKKQAIKDKRQEEKETAKKYKLARKDRLAEMTDEDLRDAISRIKNVQEYKKLTATKKERLIGAVKDKIAYAASKAATQYIDAFIDKKVKEYKETTKKKMIDLESQKKKSASSMDDEELKSSLERAKLEQQWDDYRTGSKFKVNKEGKLYVEPKKEEPKKEPKEKPINLDSETKRDVSKMTNSEINGVIDRINLENLLSKKVEELEYRRKKDT